MNFDTDEGADRSRLSWELDVTVSLAEADRSRLTIGVPYRWPQTFKSVAEELVPTTPEGVVR